VFKFWHHNTEQLVCSVSDKIRYAKLAQIWKMERLFWGALVKIWRNRSVWSNSDNYHCYDCCSYRDLFEYNWHAGWKSL